MYSIIVEATFSAVHRLRLADGVLEPVHGHDWVVRATFCKEILDEQGMVVDFHVAWQSLRKIVVGWHHGDLNDGDVLGGLNPTAEVVAKYVFDRLVADGLGSIRRVDVTEAPGCVAVYEARC